ncbi:unnamed protein product [Effrenium voratum]|nr:unnamed protein product [Effrenium voratum]
MAEEAERVQKLKEKYNQLKQANATLKKGFLDKQEECGRLEQQLKEKEITIRQQLEEIDQLQFQNGRMSKQLGTLTAQVEEQRKSHTQSSWSMGGLISGKQEAIQKAENDLAVLRDELMMKIQENEELHMRVFEAQKQHNEEAERLRDTEASRGRDLERYAAQLKASKEEVERLTGENRRMVERIGSLDHQFSASAQLSQSLRDQMEKERLESAQAKQALQLRFARWVPFDWTQHDLWTGFSLSSQQGRFMKQREEALQELGAAAHEACSMSSGALMMWPKAFGGGDEESATRIRIRGKVAELAEKLAERVKEAAPAMAKMLGETGLALGTEQRKDLKRLSNELLLIHRRWVLYQSLLLLHDWHSAFAGRSSQEEALAQSFVDCLWRLHRCVRTLVSRLRVATFLPDLSAENTSAAHFHLARRKLGRKGGAALAEDKPPGAEASQRLGLVRRSLADVSQCWRALGRCLSSWAAAQSGTGGATGTAVSQESGSVVGLLGCIHGLCACLTERLLPTVERLATQVPGPHEMPLLLRCETVSASPEGRFAYATGAKHLLESAPEVIGMEESRRVLALARRLGQNRAKLLQEMRQQAQRLQAGSNEKAQLSQELNALQDSHALLQSNYDVLKANAGAAPAEVDMPGSSNELLLSSRQRALRGLEVTAQESSGMRQHGFFVDVVNLDSEEASLAAGPPRPEVLDAWELAIRKVYEQHLCQLQKQVLIADSKAVRMGLQLQDFDDKMQRQEEEKQELIEKVVASQLELANVREDMDATRKNYDGQLGMLTEHICGLSARLSEKDAGLASLQANKMLCGRCGMWNSMGKLLSEPAGTCSTCKEKLLSRD